MTNDVAEVRVCGIRAISALIKNEGIIKNLQFFNQQLKDPSFSVVQTILKIISRISE